jgi:hypothetical protein
MPRLHLSGSEVLDDLKPRKLLVAHNYQPHISQPPKYRLDKKRTFLLWRNGTFLSWFYREKSYN